MGCRQCKCLLAPSGIPSVLVRDLGLSEGWVCSEKQLLDRDVSLFADLYSPKHPPSFLCKFVSKANKFKSLSTMSPLATVGILSIGEMGMGIAKLLTAHKLSCGDEHRRSKVGIRFPFECLRVFQIYGGCDCKNLWLCGLIVRTSSVKYHFSRPEPGKPWLLG